MLFEKYKAKFIKIVSGIIAIGLVLILTLAALGKISFGIFWIFAAASAIYTYWILPRLKKTN